MGNTNHYTEYNKLAQVAYEALAGCTHNNRCFACAYPSGTARYCQECGRRFAELGRASLAEYKRARKLEIADMPRCEFCTQRGLWRVGAAGLSTPALICGRHFTAAKRSIGNGSVFHTFTGDDIRTVLSAVTT